jgi:quercetin dioxygenase-like cupin family protein
LNDIHVAQQSNRFPWLAPPLVGLAAASFFYVYGSYLYGSFLHQADRAPLSHHGMAMEGAAGSGGASVPVQRLGSVYRPVSCERLPNVPGKSITTVVVEFAPGAYSPCHRHPGSVIAFMLKGKVRSQLNDGAIETFGVGQSWFEPPGTIHSFAENASMTEPASLLATFITDNDCGPLTIFE